MKEMIPHYRAACYLILGMICWWISALSFLSWPEAGDGVRMAAVAGPLVAYLLLPTGALAANVGLFQWIRSAHRYFRSGFYALLGLSVLCWSTFAGTAILRLLSEGAFLQEPPSIDAGWTLAAFSTLTTWMLMGGWLVVRRQWFVGGSLLVLSGWLLYQCLHLGEDMPPLLFYCLAGLLSLYPLIRNQPTEPVTFSQRVSQPINA